MKKVQKQRKNLCKTVSERAGIGKNEWRQFDGLRTSKYLIDTAIKNIEGDISIDEAQELLSTYYEENPKTDTKDRTEEADKVAVRIAKILSEKAFSFTPNEYISVHKKLFKGIYGHAGKLRDYNITKKNGCLMVQRFFMVVHQNFVQPWTRILQRKRSLVIKT